MTKHKMKDIFKDIIYVWNIIGVISAIIGIYRCAKWMYDVLNYNDEDEYDDY